MFAVALVFGAYHLFDLLGGSEISNLLDDPRLDESVRVLDGELDLQVTQIGAAVAFGETHLFGMRLSSGRETELIVEPDRIHHQRISLPMSDRVPSPCGEQIFGMTAPVQIDLPITGGVHFRDH